MEAAASETAMRNPAAGDEPSRAIEPGGEPRDRDLGARTGA
jgi:hypothetical protein